MAAPVAAPLFFGRDVKHEHAELASLVPSLPTRVAVKGPTFEAPTLDHYWPMWMYSYPNANKATLDFRDNVIAKEKNSTFARYLAMGIPGYRRRGTFYNKRIRALVAARDAAIKAGAAPRTDLDGPNKSFIKQAIIKLGVQMKVASCAETRDALLRTTEGRPLFAFMGNNEMVLGCGQDGTGVNFIGKCYMETRELFNRAYAEYDGDRENTDEVLRQRFMDVATHRYNHRWSSLPDIVSYAVAENGVSADVDSDSSGSDDSDNTEATQAARKAARKAARGKEEEEDQRPSMRTSV